MSRIAFRNRLTLLLLLSCLLLVGALALQLYRGPQAPASAAGNTRPALAPQVDVAQSPYIPPDKKRFSEIMERPLFEPTREPPPQPLATATPAPPPPPIRLKLEGIAITPEAKVAVLRDLSSNQLLRLGEGVEHQGWLVESVSPESARLTRGEQSHELTLDPDRDLATPAARVIPVR